MGGFWFAVMWLSCRHRGFSPVDYVNPLMGSLSTFELSTGNTYPAIAMPWGMNFWVPQTGKMATDGLIVMTSTGYEGLSDASTESVDK